MPTTLPESVRENLGEQAADDLSRWFAENLSQSVVLREEYREVLSRLDVLENEVAGINERIDRMEERFEDRFDQIDQQLEEQSAQFNQRIEEQSAQFNQRIDEQSAQFNQRIDSVNERIDRLHEQMRVQTRWTIGTISLFGTIVTILLAIAEFGT